MTICSRTIKRINDREERTYSQMLLLLQIVPPTLGIWGEMSASNAIAAVLPSR